MNHLEIQILAHYLGKTLAEDQQRNVEAHLNTCKHCQQQLNVLRQTHISSSDSGLTAPPADIVRRAQAAFRRQRNRAKDLVQQVAELHFDSWQNVAAGMRGALHERQLLYSAGQFDLDMQVTQAEDESALVVRGQVLCVGAESAQLDGIELRLMCTNVAERRVITDEFGRFSISDLPEGVYSLQLISDTQDVLVEAIEIKHE